jgi:hypothetical protein
MIEFDQTKLEAVDVEPFAHKLERDGMRGVDGQWRDILARVRVLRATGMTDVEIFEEVDRWELAPIRAMISQAMDATEPTS